LTKTGKHAWIYTGNKMTKFHGNILSLSENTAKCFRGATFFDSHCMCILNIDVAYRTCIFWIRHIR